MRRPPRWTASLLFWLGAVSAAACGGNSEASVRPPTLAAPVKPSPSPAPAPGPAPVPPVPKAAPVVSAPPPSEASKLLDAVLASSRAFDIARGLVDEVGPRLSGTPANQAAVAWGVRTLRDLGLSNVRAEKIMVPRWERGAESAEIVAPHRHKLAATALGNSVGTRGRGLEAEVIGAASLDALAKLDPSAVAGKIVFLSTKMERTRDGAGYGATVPIRVFGASRAAKLGAVGVVVRSVGTDTNRIPHTGVLVYEKDVPKIPAAALSVPDAELLERLLAAGKPVRLRMALGAKTFAPVESANVVGEVPGSEKPEEIVLLGAHLDSWDVGTGALDDAAGCSVILEAARQIAALSRKPRRTVRVVLFNNEENGGAGADGYAKDHAAELLRHVVALEADTGAGRVHTSRFLGAESASPAFLSIAELLRPLGVEAAVQPARGGADIGPLRAAGVPIIDLLQDVSLYFDHHHTENDTLDKIYKEDLDQVAAAYTATTFAVADMEGDLGRIPEDKRAPRRP